MFLALALVAFAAALLLLWTASRRQAASGLPVGRVIYSDTSDWGPLETPLFDPVLQLVGRPDYLVSKGKLVIPVEVKAGRTPELPYESHVYQLAAYCVLTEKHFGVRPPYGIVHYPKRTFAVDFTEALEEALLDLLTEIRSMENKRKVDRSHEQASRCVGCGYAYDCEQAI